MKIRSSVILITLSFAIFSFPVRAVIAPLYQISQEFRAIFSDKNLKKIEEKIGDLKSLVRKDKDAYVLTTEKCVLEFSIKDQWHRHLLTPGWTGSRHFKAEMHKPQCQGDLEKSPSSKNFANSRDDIFAILSSSVLLTNTIQKTAAVRPGTSLYDTLYAISYPEKFEKTGDKEYHVVYRCRADTRAGTCSFRVTVDAVDSLRVIALPFEAN